MGGYTAFIFDATAARKDGGNVLAVKVDNAGFPGLPSNGNGWVHYGGLNRTVRKLTTNAYSIDPSDFASPGVYISQGNVGSANAGLSIRTMLRNASGSAKTFAVSLVVCDSSDEIVATLRDSLQVPANTKSSLLLTGNIANPKLWSLGSPYLYRIYAELRVDGAVRDMVAQRTGFRSYQLTASAFVINGAQKLLRGAGLHAEDEAAWSALDSLAIKRQYDVAQDMGMNLIRLVHYPHSPAAYSLADERGLAVFTENGLYQNSVNVGSSERDDNTREMVKQNFNHPSILWWGRPTVPLVRILGKHWYLRAASRDIKIYSNRASLTLSVNGADKGTKADGSYVHASTGGVINNVFYFDSVLAKGRNTVIASDGAGNADTAVIYFAGDAPAAPADTAETIANLASGNPANPAYFVNQPVQSQWPAYYQCDGKADNTFDTIPALLTGARWIATRRQSQDPTDLSFTVKDPRGAHVYFMMTKQAGAPPWVAAAGFAPTGVSAKWRDNAMDLVDYELYGKTFPAGAEVKLGSSAIDFVVLVKTSGVSGVRERARAAALSRYAFLSADRRIAVPRISGDIIRAVGIYDLSGKCLQKAILRGDQDVFIAGQAAGQGVRVIRVWRP